MKVLRSLSIIVLVVGLATIAFAEEVQRKAKIIDIDGEVTVKRLDKDWVMGQKDMLLGEGDIIVTKGDSEVLLNVNGHGETATVTVRENSQLMLTELIEDENGVHSTLLELAIGKVLIKAQKLQSGEEKFEVMTPTTIVGVRGTTFEVEVGVSE